ncbi:CpsD/CapB family tyrosine-protein kinase [Ruminococcus sp.]|uniref:CpsD/CapB family tyrosine-protein kinase n=1 Tax=Ruminococcus sp. TaxID=41978 RepID=UPI0025FE5AD3|nr:CpsD/CapB family tyrosine-protein kinase [Ruminococcus sp.]MBR1431532.1 CpsD/CapB family tyrosine-protein kinase [Ruminococcus sp.]
MSLFGLKKKDRNKIAFADSIRQERQYLIWSNKDFFLRESYKSTRTNVKFSLAGVEGCKIFGVISSMQSEGKSITAANLAMSFADTGASVLLIDCDLRKPKLSRLLETSGDRGLSDVLMDFSLLSSSIVQVKDGKRLWLLSSGSIPPNPSELLGSETMQKLIEILSNKFDYIILDTPPVDMVTDALVLNPIIDGMLFVVRAGASDRRAIQHAIDQLEYTHTKILGIVFNGSDSASGGYGYKKYGYGKYGYRRYGYSYGYQNKVAYVKETEEAQKSQEESTNTQETND